MVLSERLLADHMYSPFSAYLCTPEKFRVPMYIIGYENSSELFSGR